MSNTFVANNIAYALCNTIKACKSTIIHLQLIDWLYNNDQFFNHSIYYNAMLQETSQEVTLLPESIYVEMMVCLAAR